jgi:hypothetical protein
LPHDTAARPSPNNWPGFVRIPREEADAYEQMIVTLRGFLDKLAGARPDPAMTAALASDLAGWSDRLDGCAVAEHEQMFARILREPGRGQTMTPPLIVDAMTPGEFRGRVTFGRYFLGVGAVHGGAIPLMFDEVLARAAASREQQRLRTAYLNCAFKALTPIDVELQVRSWLDRSEGRKFFVRGELRNGDVVCAEAKALFVALKPEQA